MPDKVFLDTNIFVYSFDSRAARKQRHAQDLIESALDTRQAVISTQVIQEFLNVASTKFIPVLNRADCQRYLDAVLAPLCEVYPSLSLYQQALDLREETGYGFYDSLIIAAALHSSCDILYSEDLQHGRAIHTLRIMNPFLQAPRPLTLPENG